MLKTHTWSIPSAATVTKNAIEKDRKTALRRREATHDRERKTPHKQQMFSLEQDTGKENNENSKHFTAANEHQLYMWAWNIKVAIFAVYVSFISHVAISTIFFFLVCCVPFHLYIYYKDRHLIKFHYSFALWISFKFVARVERFLI